MTNIALTPLSTYLCPDWSIRRPMELPGERFHGTFCTSPSLCLHFCFIILSSFQGSAYVLLSLPKTDSKTEFMEGLSEKRLLKSPWESLIFWHWLFSWTRVKKTEYLLGENSDFIMWMGVSRLSVEIHLQRETLHRSQGSAMQEEETWITKSNNCREVETTNNPFWLRNLSGCARVQEEPQASANLSWKEMYHWTYTKLK